MGAGLSSIQNELASRRNPTPECLAAHEAFNLARQLIRTSKHHFSVDAGRNPEYINIPATAHCNRLEFEECITQANRKRIRPAVRDRVSKHFCGPVAPGLTELVYQTILELLQHPPGTYPCRTFTVLNSRSDGRITRLDIYLSLYRFQNLRFNRTWGPVIACEVVESSTGCMLTDKELQMMAHRWFHHSPPRLREDIFVRYRKGVARTRRGFRGAGHSYR